MPRHTPSTSSRHRSHPYAKFKGVTLTGCTLTRFATVALLVGRLPVEPGASSPPPWHYEGISLPPTGSDAPTCPRAQVLHMTTSSSRVTLDEDSGPVDDAVPEKSVEGLEAQPDGNEDGPGGAENSGDEGYASDEVEDNKDDGEEEEPSDEDDEEYHEPRRSQRLASGRQPGAVPSGEHARALCKECGRTYFDRKHDLARHILGHNKDPSKRPLKCTHKDCFWTFNQRSNRDSHIEKVHASKAHRCDRQLLNGKSWRPCLFTCNAAKNLTRHQNLHH